MTDRPFVDFADLDDEACSEWLRRAYQADPLLVIRPFRFDDPSGAFQATVLMYVPGAINDSDHRLGRVDIYIAGVLQRECQEGFLPLYYDFVVGVVDVAWTNASEPSMALLQTSLRDVLERRLAEHLEGIQDFDQFRRLLTVWEPQIRRAFANSDGPLNFLAQHLRLSSTDRSMIFWDAFGSDAKTPLGDDSRIIKYERPLVEEKRLVVSSYIDPTRAVYKQLFLAVDLKDVVDARDAADYQAITRWAQASGIVVSRVDTLHMIGSRFVREYGQTWELLLSEFSELPLPSHAQAYLMGASLPPAVLVPNNDEEEDLRRPIQAAISAGASGSRLRFMEYEIRAAMRRSDHPSSWTLMLNASHPLVTLLHNLSSSSLARRIGVQQLEHFALLEATGSARTDEQWLRIEELLREIAVLELREAELHDQVEQLKSQMEGNATAARQREQHLEDSWEIKLGKKSERIRDLEEALADTRRDLLLATRLEQLDDSAITGESLSWRGITTAAAARNHFTSAE